MEVLYVGIGVSILNFGKIIDSASRNCSSLVATLRISLSPALMQEISTWISFQFIGHFTAFYLIVFTGAAGFGGSFTG